MRVVFDTNVALALIVFADPTVSELNVRWSAAEFEAVVDDATLAEFDRVLGYPELKLTEASILGARAAVRARCTMATAEAVAGADTTPLPRCSDPDDQMFLQLVQRAGAQWLLTRDKALLALRRRVRFRIARPEEYAPPG